MQFTQIFLSQFFEYLYWDIFYKNLIVTVMSYLLAGPEPTVVETTPAMSPHEMTEYLKTADFSQIKVMV